MQWPTRCTSFFLADAALVSCECVFCDGVLSDEGSEYDLEIVARGAVASLGGSGLRDGVFDNGSELCDLEKFARAPASWGGSVLRDGVFSDNGSELCDLEKFASRAALASWGELRDLEKNARGAVASWGGSGSGLDLCKK